MRGLYLALLLLICSCQNGIKEKQISFYYWRTDFNISAREQLCLDSLHAKTLYIRLFDLDTITRSDKHIDIIPISKITNSENSTSRNIVPVVYMTREAILYASDTDSMAARIARLVQQMTKEYQWHFDEIQWDCDWTPKTKQLYFDLLKKLRYQPIFSNKKFSATIRLHQIKHRSMAGIPPVDKGLLMCYNMGNLKEYGHRNSIFEAEIAADYLKHLSTYPLNLDIALPLFQWTVWFRDQRFKGLIRDVNEQSVVNNPNFIQAKEHLYSCQSDTAWLDYHFQKGDELRFESVSIDQLMKFSNDLRGRTHHDSMTILFFHLSPDILKNYPAYELQKIVDQL